MSAQPPAPPLRLVLNADGGLASVGRADFAPGPGQRVIVVPDDHYAAFVAVADALGAGEEATYDEATRRFGRRARAKSQAERDEDDARSQRAARLARLDQDIAGYAGLTAQERAAAQLNGLVILRAVVKRLMGE